MDEPKFETLRAAAMGPMTFLVDPGKYDYHNCEQLAKQRKKAADRELELKLLIDRAEQAAGGRAVSVIAYQGDYMMAREELKVIDATARAKSCRPAALRWLQAIYPTAWPVGMVRSNGHS